MTTTKTHAVSRERNVQNIRNKRKISHWESARICGRFRYLSRNVFIRIQVLKLFIPENCEGCKVIILKNKSELDVSVNTFDISTGETEACGCL